MLGLHALLPHQLPPRLLLGRAALGSRAWLRGRDGHTCQICLRAKETLLILLGIRVGRQDSVLLTILLQRLLESVFAQNHTSISTFTAKLL